MKKYLFYLVTFLSLTGIFGCGTGAPDSFMPMTRQYWETIVIDPKLSYDMAWQRVIYIITKKFELDMISKEDGYARSQYGPSYFSDVIGNNKYQVRIVAKFTPDKKKLEFKIESQVFEGKIWMNGSDTRVAANMRRDFENSLSIKKPKTKQPSTDSLKQAQPGAQLPDEEPLQDENQEESFPQEQPNNH
ncbi:MAG: hypothetical protein H3C35_00140 [Bacteroidetes bacterium]|nr:hypothetical protein [Bacteroidota bacterium]